MKHGRYDPYARDGWLVVVFIALALLVALFAPARGEETVLAERTIGQGGLICDTPDEVKAFIAKIEEGVQPQQAIQDIQGCGVLIRPMAMKVIAMETHETNKADYLLVRYEFLDVPSPPQYGVGRHVKTSRL